MPPLLLPLPFSSFFPSVSLFLVSSASFFSVPPISSVVSALSPLPPPPFVPSLATASEFSASFTL